MEIFCKHLDRQKFDVFAVAKKHNPTFLQKFRVYFGLLYGHPVARAKYRLWKQMHARIPNFEAILGKDHVIIAQSDLNLHDILIELAPDILHIHYSGTPEAPIIFDNVMKKIPIVITTNQFEIENTSPFHVFVKKMFFVSKWMLENQAHWAKQDPRAEVFYNPCELPVTTKNLRAELAIPDNAFVIGRVGRADAGIHDPISLKAYQQIQNNKTWFLALSPPTNMVEQAKALGLTNFVALPFTSSDEELSKFYNTIDVLAHARRDGETFGCNLAEAMIHGKPCVSHLTAYMNAQTETIGAGGFVVEMNDHTAYAQHLKRLRDDHSFYREIATKAKTRALEHFEGAALTKRLESIYHSLRVTERR